MSHVSCEKETCTVKLLQEGEIPEANDTSPFIHFLPDGFPLGSYKEMPF